MGSKFLQRDNKEGRRSLSPTTAPDMQAVAQLQLRKAIQLRRAILAFQHLSILEKLAGEHLSQNPDCLAEKQKLSVLWTGKGT